MKTALIFSLFFSGLCLGQQIKNVKLLDHWQDDTLLTNSTQVRYSGCWGFSYQEREYAVIGSTEGAHFFELGTDNQLRLIGFIKGRHSSSLVITREFKFYDHYIYATCDEGPSSLQIIDVSTLPDSVSLVADLQNNLFGRTHNLFIDQANAKLYLCNVTPIVNGVDLPMVPLRVFSLTNPIAPALLWEGPQDLNEVHDIYVDQNIAILNCGYDGLRVYDFSNTSNPNFISTYPFYQQQGYNHQGWLSPDKTTYVFTDENMGLAVKKFKVSPTYQFTPQSFFSTSDYPSIKTAHNLQINDNFAFIAYYNDGLRIFDLRKTDPIEIGVYDTYTEVDATNFTMWGAWGIYALYESERIVVSDRNNGLFLFHFDQKLFNVPSGDEMFKLYPNPSNNVITLRTPNDFIQDFTYSILDCQGKKLLSGTVKNESVLQLELPYASGVYFLHIDYVDYLFSSSSSVLKIVKN